MKLRSIIIDDEQTGIEILNLMIAKYFNDQVKVVATSISAEVAIDLIEDYKPDIIFLDISMPQMNGFELLDRLKWRNFKLIFTTAYQEYALKALKANAVDYLLKPIDHRDLAFSIEKIKRDLEGERLPAIDYAKLSGLVQFAADKLAIGSKEGYEYIDPENIVYLESRSNYTHVCLKDDRMIVTPKTLREFEILLCHNGRFMRVHHSFVVNLGHVLRFSKDKNDIVMINDQKIPISKSRKETFMKWLIQLPGSSESDRKVLRP